MGAFPLSHQQRISVKNEFNFISKIMSDFLNYHQMFLADSFTGANPDRTFLTVRTKSGRMVTLILKLHQELFINTGTNAATLKCDHTTRCDSIIFHQWEDILKVHGGSCSLESNFNTASHWS
ncbi:hypothetical protein AVEN_156972-1 [Araneus ventricosus]|uniref:Uncharacterized protein n=1 Tax=Araneus ventricosus TaxID=182803 RepID=A0A4Y2HKI9_ARAVE|nr:hypothetical protein AVEN_156972-1 [Araneus ventricosus]